MVQFYIKSNNLFDFPLFSLLSTQLPFTQGSQSSQQQQQTQPNQPQTTQQNQWNQTSIQSRLTVQQQQNPMLNAQLQVISLSEAFFSNRQSMPHFFISFY